MTQPSVHARIFQAPKTAMQSGLHATHVWHVVYQNITPPTIDSTMGWTGTQDTNYEITLTFPSLEDAVAYAANKHLAYTIESSQDITTSRQRPKSYSDNYKHKKPL